MIIGVFYDLSCVLTGVITRWKSINSYNWNVQDGGNVQRACISSNKGTDMSYKFCKLFDGPGLIRSKRNGLISFGGKSILLPYLC